MVRLRLLQRLHDAARADAFVGNPFRAAVGVSLDCAILLFGNAGVMQSHDVPVVVEHR